MFEHTSRYYTIETVTHTTPDGRTIAHKRRRFLPQGEEMQTLVEVTVAEGDRLDMITARTIGNPEQFWCVCDANDCMNPVDLTAKPGASVRVPLPKV